MNLECEEKMPSEKTLNKSIGRGIKSLYKMARGKLFKKQYYCMYCDIIDFDGEWTRIHIRYNHDEIGKPITQFICKLCNETINEYEIIHHILDHSK